VIDLAVMNNDYSLKYVYLQIQKDAKYKLIESVKPDYFEDSANVLTTEK